MAEPQRRHLARANADMTSVMQPAQPLPVLSPDPNEKVYDRSSTIRASSIERRARSWPRCSMTLSPCTPSARCAGSSLPRARVASGARSSGIRPTRDRSSWRRLRTGSGRATSGSGSARGNERKAPRTGPQSAQGDRQRARGSQSHHLLTDPRLRGDGDEMDARRGRAA